MDYFINLINDGWDALLQQPLALIVVGIIFGAVVYNMTRPG